MIKLKQIIISVFVVFMSGCNKHSLEIAGQPDFYERCREIVVAENNIGKEYFFKRGDTVIDQLSVVYVGNIVSGKGDTLRILNSINFTGLYEDSRKANANTYIYNSNRKKLGYYHIGHLDYLPTSINDNRLIFDYNNEDCNLKTAVEMHHQLPPEIFIQCDSQGGDVYKFFKQ